MNISKDDLLKVINLSIDDTNILLEHSLKLDKVKMGSSKCFESLDSLGIVNFLFNIENNFQKNYQIKVNLLNDTFYDDPAIHLSNIDNFITFIENCLNESS